MGEPLTATCAWCGVPLVAADGTWTDHAGSGDYCPEGLAVGPTGTSPHLPRVASQADSLDVERLRQVLDNE